MERSLYFLLRRRLEWRGRSEHLRGRLRHRPLSPSAAEEPEVTALSISSLSLCSSSASRAFCSPITCDCSSSFFSWSCSCFCCSSCLTRTSCISRRSAVIDAPFTFTCCCTFVSSERDGVFLASRDMVVREVEGPATARQRDERFISSRKYFNSEER